MKLEITTPDKLIYSGNVAEIITPGEAGEFGVLPEHSPLISTLKTGVIGIIEENKNTRRVFVAGGLAEVNQTETSILTSEAYDLSEITKEQVQEKLDQAKLRLKLAESDIERNLAQEQINVSEALAANI